MYGRIHDCG